MYINALTRNAYSANNQKLLAEPAMLAGFEEFEVAGFKQWLELGRVVQKGQKGTRVLMVCDKKEKDSDGDETKRKVCKSRTVFFKSQTVELQSEAA